VSSNYRDSLLLFADIQENILGHVPQECLELRIRNVFTKKATTVNQGIVKGIRKFFSPNPCLSKL
jgi:hypothetical protein